MDTEDSLREYLAPLRAPAAAWPGSGRWPAPSTSWPTPRRASRRSSRSARSATRCGSDHYDLVVVDAAASGHIAGQLSAPWTINDLVQVGLVRDQTRWMTDILADPAQTGVVVVTTAEELPVVETLELVDAPRGDRARSRTGRGRRQPRAAGAVHAATRRRCSPPCAPPAAVGALAARGAVPRRATSRRSSTPRRWRWPSGASGPGTSPCCRSGCRPGLGIGLVPELFARSHGKRAVMQVAEALAEELS